MSRKKRSTKGITRYWYNVYYKALSYYDDAPKPVKNPTKASVNKLRKKWKALQKTEKTLQIEGTKARVTVKQAYEKQIFKEKQQADWRNTPRDEELRTEPLPQEDVARMDWETVENFKALAKKIYDDTTEYMDRVRDKSDHDEGKLGNLASYGQVTSSYESLIQWIDDTIAVEGVTFVADLIAKNNYLDYTMAIVLVPPSDVEYVFEATIDELQASLESYYNEITGDNE